MWRTVERLRWAASANLKSTLQHEGRFTRQQVDMQRSSELIGEQICRALSSRQREPSKFIQQVEREIAEKESEIPLLHVALFSRVMRAHAILNGKHREHVLLMT